MRILWVMNRQGNTGQDDSLQDLVTDILQPDGKDAIIEKQANINVLEQWCKENNYVEYPTTMMKAIGAPIRCYAKFGVEYIGKNNVLATYLTCQKDTGLAVTDDNESGIMYQTVIGKALIVRLDSKGQPIDWSKKDLFHILCFINDMMKCFPFFEDRRDENGLPQQTFYMAAKNCLPYYHIGDKFNGFSFQGENGRSMDGVSLKKNPSNMQTQPSHPTS